MKLLALLFNQKKSEEPKTVDDYQRENLVNIGRQQFQKLKDLGLGAPIILV